MLEPNYMELVKQNRRITLNIRVIQTNLDNLSSEYSQVVYYSGNIESNIYDRN